MPFAKNVNTSSTVEFTWIRVFDKQNTICLHLEMATRKRKAKESKPEQQEGLADHADKKLKTEFDSAWVKKITQRTVEEIEKEIGTSTAPKTRKMEVLVDTVKALRDAADILEKGARLSPPPEERKFNVFIQGKGKDLVDIHCFDVKCARATAIFDIVETNIYRFRGVDNTTKRAERNQSVSHIDNVVKSTNLVTMLAGVDKPSGRDVCVARFYDSDDKLPVPDKFAAFINDKVGLDLGDVLAAAVAFGR